MDSAAAIQESAFEAAYARFGPRLRAVVINSIVMVLTMFGAIFAAVAVGSDNLARTLGFTVAALWLLYEPILVSFTGGTIGHWRSNLRVVDDRTHGNVSFLKAVARAVIKGVLGWVSFVSMLTTRRSQAIHDLLTRSTVQIRDAAKAGPKQFIRERTEFDSPALPSRTHRSLVIVTYIVVFSGLYAAAALGIMAAGAITEACLADDRCTRGDENVFTAVAALWIAGCIVTLALGWRGRLNGARRRSA